MIKLKKVAVHNLKDVDLELPQNQLIVFTGVSGSGKSSMAFDTIFVEGQRRYVESLSTFARRSLGELARPELESAQNLAPTISIEQKTAGKNPRSTVGTLTEVYDFLRVLFARLAIPHCPISHEPVTSQSKERIVKTIQGMEKGAVITILAPLAKAKKGTFIPEMQLLEKRGFTRVRIDGKIVDLDPSVQLDGNLPHDFDVVVDRVKVDEENAARIAESTQLALDLGAGVCCILIGSEERLFSTHAYSKKSNRSYTALEPHDFSFNSPQGMCPACQGLGIDGLICPSCKGARIRPYPAAARFGSYRIADITQMTIEKALEFFTGLNLSTEEALIGSELIKEICFRLRFLVDVGLHYLTLDRTAPTLSGGEAQRVRLASQIGCGLVNVIYILDEPSIGLHPQDNIRLIETLKRLRDLGNTVIVVEHDEETILHADHIVDFGPGPGVLGGQIIYEGAPANLKQSKTSLTGDYLFGRKEISIPKTRRSPMKGTLEIIGANHHNLKNVDVAIPLGLFIGITGVSGSGKSTLIFDVLQPWLESGKLKSDAIDKVICIDQSPIGRTPRSNPATYIKLFDPIRDLYTQLPESKAKGFLPGRFSFNVEDGSCATCQGMGMVRVDMDFMEDAWVTCSSCEGRRFDEETLAISFKGKSISDILAMSVEEAHAFFESQPLIRKRLEVLKQVGLGYLSIGQPSPTLSGGEAQRIKLARELVKPPTGRTLYLLDEPTTGLHFDDIKKLLKTLQALVDHGNTVVCIEHNMDIIKCVDWIIDLGPGGGAAGGRIVSCGPPESIAKLDTATGQELKRILSKRHVPVSQVQKKKPSNAIMVRGVSVHNLKEIDVEIPHGKITLCTGPSGSGKSSLAFDTIYAEGQRRYTESLSAYARQFVHQMPKPKVSFIEGLTPAIAIEQKSSAGNPRSTVGTLTEIYDYLRILYARQGVAYCPKTGEKIQSITKEYVADRLLELPEGSLIAVLAPIDLQRHEDFETLCERFSKRGFLRLYLNGELFELDEKIPFDRARKNKIALVVDRLKLGSRHRLLEALESASSLSKGSILVVHESKELFFNLSFSVPSTGESYPTITPKSFAFNTEEGMCLECLGLGVQYGANVERFPDLSLASLLNPGCDKKVQSSPLQKGVWYSHPNGYSYRFRGLDPVLAEVGHFAPFPFKQIARQWLDEIICPSCKGSRLNPLASAVRLQNLTIQEFTNLPLNEAADFINKLKVPKLLQEVAEQIRSRLSFLLSMGLHYIGLSRTAPTLSNGEAQRIRLARQLGSGLTGVLYVLDEPTTGLHPQEIKMLNDALLHLKNLGNTLLLVEHDPMTIEIADKIIDLGPMAGSQGGTIMAQGTLAQIKKNPRSLTGAYLSGRKKIPVPKERRPFQAPLLSLQNVSMHNIKNLFADFPIGAWTTITGPSGSGKSTLLYGILRPFVQTHLYRNNLKNREFGKAGDSDLQQAKPALSEAMLVTWPSEVAAKMRMPAKPKTDSSSCFGIAPHFDKLIMIDSDPIGHTIRSDVATYTDLLTPIRYFFAELPLSRAMGLLPRHFSYNIKAGMCGNCWGLGKKSIQLQFLPPVQVVCPDCRGLHLNQKSLKVTYMGKNLGQILKLTVEEVKTLFSSHPRIRNLCDTLISVGLGYLTLDQEVQTLSGGEAQRLKLSFELSRRSQGRTLFLIDEPTTGLHSIDIEKLVKILHHLVDLGNTVIAVEHNIEFIRNSDYIMDMGPGGGSEGGRIVAQGTPEEISSNPQSPTGKYL